MDTLIEDIEGFCALNQMSERQFGELVLNDAKLVPQLRAGRDVRMSTVARIRAFMAAYRADAA